ncbi:hypothetical protein K402DRAFT_394391, partial [Aulographum hederae CBS 113979]
MNASISVITIPSIQAAPASQQPALWAKMYDIGHKLAPTGAIGSSLAFSYLATQAYRSSLTSRQPFYLFTFAAIVIPAIVPYTLAFMHPNVNYPLFAKADAQASGALETKDEGEIERLVSDWAWYNNIRAAMITAGAVAGVWGVVGLPGMAGGL